MRTERKFLHWYYNLRISRKLTVAFAAVILILVYIGCDNILKLRDAATMSKNLYEKRMVPVEMFMELSSNAAAAKALTMNALTAASDKAQENRDKVAGLAARNAEVWTQYRNFPMTEQEKDLAVKFEEKAAVFQQTVTKVFELMAADKFADAEVLANKDVDGSFSTAAVSLDALVKYQSGEAANLYRRIGDNAFKSTISSVVAILAGIALSVGAVMMLIRSIAKPIATLVSFAKSVAEGDLTRTVEVQGGGEIGELTSSLNAMVDGLSGMAFKIKKSSEQLTQASRNIIEASKQVMGAATVQAGGVEDTSTAITHINASMKGIAHGVQSLDGFASESSSSTLEMAANVEEVAQHVGTLNESVEGVSVSITETAAAIRQIDGSAATLKDAYVMTAGSVAELQSSIRQVEHNAQQTTEISAAVLRDAESGKLSVEATATGILEIKRASTITSDVINTLSSRAEQIGAILQVIDDLAGQTRLLALNAAIIAAQAGEQGKGFNVVADEIKTLADRTSASSREIAHVITAVQEETNRAVIAIAEAEKSIAAGETLSQNSREALAKIVSGMQQARDRINEIARTTVEQAKGSGQIRAAMEQVSDMVEQIAKATGEQRRGSEVIIEEVERMKDLTAQVKVSTREQSAMGKFIAKSTADMTEKIRHITLACDEQTKGSDQIVQAAESIRSSTSVNLEAARLMDRAVSGMSGQILVLEEAMAEFKVRSEMAGVRGTA